MSNKKVVTGSGNLMAGNASISGVGKVTHTSVSANLVSGNSSMSGFGTVTPAVITEAIEKNIEIPPGAKEPIKDFITESFNELWSTVEELMNISPPMELAEYWEIVLQIIQSFL